MNNQNKIKILIIPSWYPTKKRPIEGSFFHEQALALSQLYDIKIFYPNQKKVGRFLRLLNTFLYLLKITPSVEFAKDNFSNYPEIFDFQYTGGIGKLKLEGEILSWECNAAYQKIIKTGWIPDLIHAQSTSLGGIISYLISKKYKIPYIITEHSIFLFHLYPKEIQLLMKKALENANNVIAVSEHQKRMILIHDINCCPEVVGNMIDDSVFKIEQKKNKIFTILFISFDSYIKDNETFFKAIKMFHQKTKEEFNVKLLGRSLKSLKENPFFILANKYDLLSNVDIIENVEREKIATYFQNSDVLVSTSIAETFGVSMCEALFSGIPIISTANGGVEDMVDDKNGIKVNIKDEEAICDALLKISNKEIVFNPQVIRNTIIDKFSKEVFIKRIDKIYRTALK
jgi:glycosyltransferase involved in cell wall biosynthesis